MRKLALTFLSVGLLALAGSPGARKAAGQTPPPDVSPTPAKQTVEDRLAVLEKRFDRLEVLLTKQTEQPKDVKAPKAVGQPGDAQPPKVEPDTQQPIPLPGEYAVEGYVGSFSGQPGRHEVVIDLYTTYGQSNLDSVYLYPMAYPGDNGTSVTFEGKRGLNAGPLLDALTNAKADKALYVRASCRQGRYVPTASVAVFEYRDYPASAQPAQRPRGVVFQPPTQPTQPAIQPGVVYQPPFVQQPYLSQDPYYSAACSATQPMFAPVVGQSSCGASLPAAMGFQGTPGPIRGVVRRGFARLGFGGGSLGGCGAGGAGATAGGCGN